MRRYTWHGAPFAAVHVVVFFSLSLAHCLSLKNSTTIESKKTKKKNKTSNPPRFATGNINHSRWQWSERSVMMMRPEKRAAFPGALPRHAPPGCQVSVHKRLQWTYSLLNGTTLTCKTTEHCDCGCKNRNCEANVRLCAVPRTGLHPLNCRQRRNAAERFYLRRAPRCDPQEESTKSPFTTFREYKRYFFEVIGWYTPFQARNGLDSVDWLLDGGWPCQCSGGGRL